MKGVKAGPRIIKSKSRRPEPVEQHRAGRNHKPEFASFAAADSSAPTRKGIKRTSPNAGEKARPSPRCCFGATPLVGELPRSNGQTTAWPAAPSRVREAGVKGKRGPPMLFWRDPSRGRAPP